MEGAHHGTCYICRSRRARKVDQGMRLQPVHRRGGAQDVRVLACRGRLVDPRVRGAEGRVRVGRDGLPPAARAGVPRRRLRAMVY